MIYSYLMETNNKKPCIAYNNMANNSTKTIEPIVTSEKLEEIFLLLLEKQKLDKISNDYLNLNYEKIYTDEWFEHKRLKDASDSLYIIFRYRYNEIIEKLYGSDYDWENIYDILFRSYGEKYFKMVMIDKRGLDIEEQKIVYAGLQRKLEFNY